jgi:hypothetical protein
VDQLSADDFRANNPRFVGGNFEQNMVKHVSLMEQNAAAIGITLTAEQVARLSALQAPVGDRYADMSRINR